MQRQFTSVACIALLALASGCEQQPDAATNIAANIAAKTTTTVASAVATESSNSVNPFKPSASLQEIMLSVIDPNIDPIWNAISTEVTEQGEIETRPESDEDWATLRNHAISLREASNLLVIEGRAVAHSHANTSSHESELQTDAIQVLIAAQWPEFIARAHALHDAANLAIEAIDAKNVERLEEVGGIIEHSCEGCHSQFWYPGDKVPTY
jgi:cytochrome c556